MIGVSTSSSVSRTMSLHALLIPALREREHRLAHAFHLLVVGAEEQVHDLRVDAAHDRALRDQALSVEAAAERHDRARRDHRLVEIEEGRFHRAASVRGRNGRGSPVTGSRTPPLTVRGPPYRPRRFPRTSPRCSRARAAHGRRREGVSRARLLLVAQGRLGDLGDRRGRGARARAGRARARRRPRRRSAGRARPRGRSRSGPARLAARRARGADRRARPAGDRRRARVWRCCPRALATSRRATPEAGAALAVALRADPRPTVVDVGVLGADAGSALHALVEVADVHVIVVRGCYLALRRAVRVELDRARGRCGVRRRGRPFARRPRRARTCSASRSSRRSGSARRPPRRRCRRAPHPASRRARPDPRARCSRRVGCHRARGGRRERSTRPSPTAAPRGVAPAAARGAVRPGRARAAASCGRGSTRCCTTRRRSSPTRRRPACSTSSSPRSTGSVRCSRCSRIPAITEIMVNGPDRVFVERARPPRARSTASSTPTRSCASPQRVIAPLGLRLDRAVADGRRPPRRRLAAARGAPAARARRSVPDDPAVLGRVRSRSPTSGSATRAVAFLEAMVRAGWNIVVVGRDERGQDHVREHAGPGDRSRRADRHDRGDRRAAARASARRAARSAPAERRRRRAR